MHDPYQNDLSQSLEPPSTEYAPYKQEPNKPNSGPEYALTPMLPDQYPNVSYPPSYPFSYLTPNTITKSRKKPPRAVQACDNCRLLKTKCNELRPKCTSCQEKDVKCHYGEPPAKQTGPEYEILRLVRIIMIAVGATEESTEETTNSPSPASISSTPTSHTATALRPLNKDIKYDEHPQEKRIHTGSVEGYGDKEHCAGSYAPSFSEETVCDLADSYNQHILNWYPVLLPSNVSFLIHQFFPPSLEASGEKRKRQPYVPAADLRSSGSINSALLLLVMALGKIFLHKGKLSNALRTDLIPGYCYFAPAVEILHTHYAENSLEYIHANILACLYRGQLGQIRESYKYLITACRRVQEILRSKFSRLKMANDSDESRVIVAEDNALCFTFWTCLQLESDILTEFPYPPSGISIYEGDVPSPNWAIGNIDSDSMAMESYMTQLIMRKFLNPFQNDFVGVKDREERIKAGASFVKLVKSAPSIKWDVDTGEPAKDILGARLRLRYYDKQAINYRPFMLQMLECPEYLTIEMIDSVLLESARNGIKSLIYSMQAFYNLGDLAGERFIASIWGIAHAQLKNILTLQTACMNPILSSLILDIITEDALQDLFTKTNSLLSRITTVHKQSISLKVIELGAKNGLA